MTTILIMSILFKTIIERPKHKKRQNTVSKLNNICKKRNKHKTLLLVFFLLKTSNKNISNILNLRKLINV